MIDGLVAGTMSEYKKSNELLLVTATAVALDNVGGYRFRGAADLASLLVHLELGQVLERHAMHSNRYFSRQLPNLEIAIAHSGSRILHLASRITVPVRSAQEFAPPVYRTAAKAKPGHASKPLPILRSAFALCPGRKRKTSSLESRWPALRLY